MPTVEAPKVLNVEKIYVTRNYKMAKGSRTSKVVGLVVDGSIYWLKHVFVSTNELYRIFYQLNIALNPMDKWGMTDKYGKAELDKALTKISKDPLAVLAKDSSYIERSVLTKDGSIFWSAAALRDEFPDTPWYYPDN